MKHVRIVLFILVAFMLCVGWYYADNMDDFGKVFLVLGSAFFVGGIIALLNGPGGTPPPDFPP